MASKSSKAANGRASTESSTVAAEQEAGSLAFAQQQMLNLIALTDVMFKGAEEMRRCQMEAARDARRHYEKAQAGVASAATATDLLNVEGELLRYDMESAGQYWQKLAAICTTTQAEALNLMTRGAALAGTGLTQLMAKPVGLPAFVPSAGVPAASADAGATADPSQAWNRLVDFGKQWTDMLYRSEAALH